MSRREEWRKVLDKELHRWSAMSSDQLAAALREDEAYQVEVDSKTYQVEVELLEDTKDYVHVMVSVDDGSLPDSIWPSTRSFIRNRETPST